MDSAAEPTRGTEVGWQANLTDARGERRDVPTRQDVTRIRDEGGFVWLDLTSPAPDVIEWLGGEFGFHPLALEDALHFGQRPKIDEYEHHALLVAYGLDLAGLPVEVHCFARTDALVTVHRDPCPALDELRARLDRRGTGPTGAMALHSILDGLTDSFFPALSEVDEQIEALDQVLLDAGDDVPSEIFAAKRRLTRISRLVRPQRDMVARLAGGMVEVPGVPAGAEHHFRDVYDHLLRIEAAVEEYRDLLTGATEVHLAAVSNRLNRVMKQLTVIATVFLPLTFVTGYFGQNFPWLVEHIGGGGWFLALGVVGQLALAAALVVWFRVRGWV